MRSVTSYPEPLEPVTAGLRTWRIPELEPVGQGLRVWLLTWPTEPPESDQRSWLDLLGEDERVRCAHIGTRNGRIRFAASHAAARLLVPERRTWQERRASLSHTAQVAVVACADVCVGIDVEADVPRPRWSAADRQQWPESPAGNWPSFVERWVRHEAAFKCGSEERAGSAAVGRIRGLTGLPDHVLAVVGVEEEVNSGWRYR